MPLSEEKLREYNRRLLFSRMRVLINNGFYGLLLMHMKFAIDEKCETAATDGCRIYFGPEFMDNLSDSEIDFILMHEILHVVLNHCERQCSRDSELYNIACDIVVNSNILYSNNFDKNSITTYKYGEFMHAAPNGDEGYKYTAEEVYEMLETEKVECSGSSSGNSSGSGEGNDQNKKEQSICDDHSRWGKNDDGNIPSDVWVKRMNDAAEAVSISEGSNTWGMVPFFAQRMLERLKKPQTDWKTILADFIQEEVCDYSFSPPDRRFSESPFFLPDFNDTETSVSDILFMIDTSASMSDKMVTQAYSEVKGAIDQFDGKLCGWLGFFDAEVVKPEPFQDEEDFKVIKPVGGGGTNFKAIFKYVNENMNGHLPASIIILTDGFAPFPNKAIAGGIPVLWIINNNESNPPWGKIARIKPDI